MRKLASIQKINNINPILGADNIEMATVLGWNCIVKKGEFRVNDLVVYIEIDSILPERPEFEFLRSKKFKIKTWKLKKFNAISQGIIFGLHILPMDLIIGEGSDVTDILKVKKIEQEDDPITTFTIKKGRNRLVNYLYQYSWFRQTIGKWLYSGKDNRGFPNFISKTDETRIQSLAGTFSQYWAGTSGWSCSEKIDGQSVTYAYVTTTKRFLGFPTKKKEFVVCSRNLNLGGYYPCSWHDTAKAYDVQNKLSRVPFDVAIQGEIIGTSIQGNKYSTDKYRLFVFNVKNLNTNTYLSNKDVELFCKEYGFESVPYINHDVTLPTTIDELVKLSIGNSTLKPINREGYVYRKDEHSFKVINPEFLLKYEV